MLALAWSFLESGKRADLPMVCPGPQEDVSLVREELAVMQESSGGPRLAKAEAWEQQKRLRSSEETLLLKEA